MNRLACILLYGVEKVAFSFSAANAGCAAHLKHKIMNVYDNVKIITLYRSSM